MVVTIAAAVPREEKFAELREAGNPNPKQEVAARRSADNVTVAGNTTGPSNVTNPGNTTTPSNVTKPDNVTRPDNVHQGRVLKEVKFEGGKAGSSSLFSTYKGRKPDNAFIDNEITWWSGKNKEGKGEYQSFPHLMWYDFDKQIVPGEVGIGRSTAKKQSPIMWDFIGSNDSECNKYSAWTILCSDRSGKPFPGGKFGMKYCAADEKMKASYRCLGIRVLNVDGDDRDVPMVQIRLIRMWANVSS